MHAIRNADHALRSQDPRPCEQCGRTFRPWKFNTVGRFCSNECAGAFRHEAATARWAARRGPRDPEAVARIAAECRRAYAAFKAAVEARR